MSKKKEKIDTKFLDDLRLYWIAFWIWMILLFWGVIYLIER